MAEHITYIAQGGFAMPIHSSLPEPYHHQALDEDREADEREREAAEHAEDMQTAALLACNDLISAAFSLAQFPIEFEEQLECAMNGTEYLLPKVAASKRKELAKSLERLRKQIAVRARLHGLEG